MQTTHALAAPRRLLLIKSKIAHSAGMYLWQGRWHKIKEGKPVPKGAPVAMHPHAAGQHLPAFHFSDEQWAQLKLPDSNVNAPTFNKQLDQVKELSDAGNVTALLGMKLGTNTYSVKLGKIINTLLGMHGSPHQVAPGQAAGSHEAVKQVPDGTDTDVGTKPAPEPEQPQPVEPTTATGPEFDDSFGKAAYYNKLAAKLTEASDNGPEALESAFQSLKGAAVLGKTKNSKILLGYHKQLKGKHAAQTATEALGSPAPGPEQPAAPAPEPKKQTLGDLIKETMKKDAAASKVSQIPWETLKLPASNTNAGTYNKKIDDIKAAAEAGDLAKLEGMKFGKNTYNVKAAKIAATAIAALKESAPQAPEPVQPLKVEEPKSSLDKIADAADPSIAEMHAYAYISEQGKTKESYQKAAGELTQHEHYKQAKTVLTSMMDKYGPQEGDTKEGADGMLVLKDGHWVKQEQPEPVAAVPAPTGLDAITIPDFEALSPGKHGSAYKAIAEQLLSTVKSEGIGGIKGNITKHKSGKFSVKAAGWQLKHIGPNDPVGDPIAKARRAAMHKFITDLYATAPKAKKAAKPKVAAPAPSPIVGTGNTPAIDHWEQTGPQGGSNPGGRFKDENGVEWYCKFPADENIAKSEILAAKLYAAVGVVGQDAKLITKGGKVGIASRWVEVSKASSPAALSKVDGVKQGFVADAWLGNWDVVGLGYDNLQIGADGKAVRVDAGGSLEYRAQGGKKVFGNSVIELDSLIDSSINPQSAAVFGKMTKADIAASASKVASLSDASIRILVNTYGPGDENAKQQLADTLIARKADIIAKYPKSKKEKVITFKPEKISAPPSFTNWGGTGKSGPSSKEFLNQANEKAVQAIFEAAKTGKVDKVQSLSADIYNKDTGEAVGSAKVVEHPSQHVKGYAQQAINEINYQMNPPKRFRFDGGHPLHSLNAAYPSHKGALHGSAVSKVAKYILLGEPGTVSLDALALPKLTSKSGQLSKSTYAKAAQDAFDKMPLTQKQAVRAYTGNGYHAMNNSLWDGNPSGEAKAAAEALHTLGHDLEPGTILSRKISIHGADLEALLKTSGKVIQEPAIMSTAITPSSWSGNVHLKLHVGPGVKGLWVGYGSQKDGGAISKHAGEDEIILPPNTRMLVISTKKSGGIDADGFGGYGYHVIEAVILPTQDHS